MASKEWLRANREAWQQKITAFKRTNQTALDWCKEKEVDYKKIG